MKLRLVLSGLSLCSCLANADSTLDAAIGGGLGGAAGAAIGNELGGREGAILGGAAGAAAGAAIATDGSSSRPKETVVVPAPRGGGHPHDYHCPPGQRKKGRC